MSEQDPTQSRLGAVMERAGEAIGSLKDSLETRTAVLASALTLAGGVAVHEAVSTEPAMATEAVPTLQNCANQLAKPPVGTKAERVGLKGSSRAIEIQAKYLGASEECQPILQETDANFVGKVKIDIVGCRILSMKGCLPPLHKTTGKSKLVSGLQAQEINERVFSNEGYPGVLFCLPGPRRTSRTATFINQVKRNNKVIAESRKKVKVIDPGAYC